MLHSACPQFWQNSQNAHLPASLQRRRTFPCLPCWLLSKHSVYGCDHKVPPWFRRSTRLCCRSLDSGLAAVWLIIGVQFCVVGAEMPLSCHFDPFFCLSTSLLWVSQQPHSFFFFAKGPIFQLKLGFSLQSNLFCWQLGAEISCMVLVSLSESPITFFFGYLDGFL